MRQQYLPGGTKFHAAPDLVEVRHAELAFEFPDLVRERRLGDVEFGGGAGEVRLLRDGMMETIEPGRFRFDGKLWIDITEPFNDRYDDFILPWDSSGAEEIQERFPRARVVGAFKNVWW